MQFGHTVDGLGTETVYGLAVSVQRAVRQYTVGQQCFAHAPRVVEQVAEVQDVYAELEAVAVFVFAAGAQEYLLHNRQVKTVQPGEQATIALGVAAAAGAQVLVLIDECIERSNLLVYSESFGDGRSVAAGVGNNVVNRVRLEVQLAGAVGHVDQVVVAHVVAVHVACIGIRHTTAALSDVTQGDAGRATPFATVINGVTHQTEDPVWSIIVREGKFQVVVAIYRERVGPRTGSDGASALQVFRAAVGVTHFTIEAAVVHGRVFQQARYAEVVTFIHVVQYDSGRNVVVDAGSIILRCTCIQASTIEAQAVIRAGKVGCCWLKVGVEVHRCVDVFSKQHLTRRNQAVANALIQTQVRLPHLLEFEVWIGLCDLDGFRESRVFRDKLAGIVERTEGIGISARCINETGEDTVVANLVRHPYVSRAASEDAGTTTQLGVAVSIYVPVEAQTGLYQELCFG